MAEMTPQQKAEMAKNKRLSTELMVIIRDLVVSGGSPELIDPLTTLQAQYEKRGELASTQQFQALKMEEDVPPAVPGSTSQQDAIRQLQLLKPFIQSMSRPGGQTPEELDSMLTELRRVARTGLAEQPLPDLPPSDPAQDLAIERASASLQRAMKLAGTPGGLESLKEEDLARAIAAAEAGITLPGQ